jgi:hypothetical protein
MCQIISHNNVMHCQVRQSHSSFLLRFFVVNPCHPQKLARSMLSNCSMEPSRQPAIRKPKIRKSPPYWYCDQRKMFNVPLVWSKPESGNPVGGHLVLVSTWEAKGLIIRTPAGFDDTTRLLKDLHVVWWAYLPEFPTLPCQEPGPKSVEDVCLWCKWEVHASASPRPSRRTKANRLATAG